MHWWFRRVETYSSSLWLRGRFIWCMIVFVILSWCWECWELSWTIAWNRIYFLFITCIMCIMDLSCQCWRRIIRYLLDILTSVIFAWRRGTFVKFVTNLIEFSHLNSGRRRDVWSVRNCTIWIVWDTSRVFVPINDYKCCI